MMNRRWATALCFRDSLQRQTRPLGSGTEALTVAGKRKNMLADPSRSISLVPGARSLHDGRMQLEGDHLLVID